MRASDWEPVWKPDKELGRKVENGRARRLTVTGEDEARTPKPWEEKCPVRSRCQHSHEADRRRASMFGSKADGLGLERLKSVGRPFVSVGRPRKRLLASLWAHAGSTPKEREV